MRDTWNFFKKNYSVVNNEEKKSKCYETSRKLAVGLYNQKFKCVVLLAFIGLTIFGSGLLTFFLSPYDLLFKLKCVFSEGGEIFEMWRKPPVDLYLKVYLFNVTNKDAFLRGQEKLRVQEVGPYVYRERLSHENITFNNNGTISTVPYHPLEWVPELSEGHQEDDQLILPHIALLSIAQVVSEESIFTQLGLNLVIRQTESEPLVQMSAKEFMFGYRSDLLNLGNQFMPNWISFDKLGLIDRMYDFNGDYETVYTGEDDVSVTGLIDTYRGSKELPQWEGECANINKASDGTKFKSYVQPNDTLSFYRKSMCRSQTLVPVGATTESGLNAYRYNFEENANDNGQFNEKNKCYCRNGRCLPSGLLDVTGCYYGFPIATSYPHFLDADPKVRDYVDGSNPDPEKHRSFFIVNPESGLPLRLAARFQINMVLDDISGIANVGRFSKTVLPMLWTEITMLSLPDHLRMRFNLYLNILPVTQTVATYCLFAIGITFIAVAIYKYSQKFKNLNIGHIYPSPTWKSDYVEEDLNRKLSSFAHISDKESSNVTMRELDVYYSNLVANRSPTIIVDELRSLRLSEV